VLGVWQRWRPLGLLLGAVLLGFAAYGTGYAYLVPVKADFRSLGADYTAGYRDGDAVLLVPQPMAFPLGYYAKAPLKTVAAKIAPGTTEAELDRQLGADLAGYRRAWLVAAGIDLESPLLAMPRRWLARRGRLELERRYAGDLSLWVYTLDDSF